MVRTLAILMGVAVVSVAATNRPVMPTRAAGTQNRDARTEQFLARARAGTRRYQEQDLAVADGFKPVGVEFPAMGTHWVHLGRVLEDSLLPERPSVLIYVDVAGRPRLAGVAYTDLRGPEDPPPSFPAPGGWHEHNGTVADESFPLAHEMTHEVSSAVSDGEPEMRLAVLHAWLWSHNPDGVFVTNNWSLPALRLGISTPASTPHEALHALALATDEDGYLLLTLRTGLGLTVTEEQTAATVIAAQRATAGRIVAALRPQNQLTVESSARLITHWRDTWKELERALPGRVVQLRALRRQLN